MAYHLQTIGQVDWHNYTVFMRFRHYVAVHQPTLDFCGQQPTYAYSTKIIVAPTGLHTVLV